MRSASVPRVAPSRWRLVAVWKFVQASDRYGRRTRRPWRVFCGAVALAVSLMGGCSPKQQAQRAPMQVVDAWPKQAADRAPAGDSRDRPIPLYLNSNVTVSFNQDLDRLSVTEDTVRMVRVTPDGPMKVKMGRRSVKTRSVTLEPEWPVTPEFDDGSFLPGQLYMLVVEGFPLTNTVQSKTGAGLENRFVRYYRAVSAERTGLGPVLAVGQLAPFRLIGNTVRMASGMGTVLLHFTLPVDPATVSPRSFSIRVIRGQTDVEVPVRAARVLTVRRPVVVVGVGQPSYPSSTVELRLSEAKMRTAGIELRPGEPFWVQLKPAGSKSEWVRDYRGRTVTLPPARAVVTGQVSPGMKVELLKLTATPGQEAFVQTETMRTLTFHGAARKFEPLARVQAGSGILGVFRPKRSLELRPFQPFDRGDGSIVVARSNSFEFRSVFIPSGVIVTVSASARTQILSQTNIRIDGELRLGTSHGKDCESFESARDVNYLNRLADSEFGMRLLSAGTILVAGSIQHLRSGVIGPNSHAKLSPLTLAASHIDLRGPIPSPTVLASNDAQGTVQGATLVSYPLRPGLPKGRRAEARAWTKWHRLPADYRGAITARADGNVDVYLQVAVPDPMDPSLPYLDHGGMSEPLKLPLREPQKVQAGSHVRFQLHAKVIGSKPMPTLRSIVILGDP